MPVGRDEHGNIIEKPSEVYDRPAAPTRRGGRRSGGPGDEPTDRKDRGGGADRYRKATRLAGGSVGEGRDDQYAIPTKSPSDSSEAGRKGRYRNRTKPMDDSPDVSKPRAGRKGGTIVHRPQTDDSTSSASDAPKADPMNDPPVGWLVVIQGPGKGTVATLKIGVNTIGRGSENRVPLGDGDRTISSLRHCAITYDNANRQFYIQHTEGKNLTYVGSEPVLTPRTLEPGTHVRMGETVLRFVPLCGEGFSWEEDNG